jgi:hypothetical protein
LVIGDVFITNGATVDFLDGEGDRPGFDYLPKEQADGLRRSDTQFTEHGKRGCFLII